MLLALSDVRGVRRLLVRRPQGRGRHRRGLHVPAGQGLRVLRASTHGAGRRRRRDHARPDARGDRAASTYPPRLLVVGAATRAASGETPFDGSSGRAIRPTSSRLRRRTTTWRSGSSRPAAPARRRRPCTARTIRSSRSRATPEACSDTTRSDRVLPVPKLFFGYARDIDRAVHVRGRCEPGSSSRSARPRSALRADRAPPADDPRQRADDDGADARLIRGSRAGRPLVPALLRLLRRGAARRGASPVRRALRRRGARGRSAPPSSTTSTSPTGPARVRIGSVGELVPGLRGDARRRGRRRPVGDGEPGELRVRGESMARLLRGDEEQVGKRTFAGELGPHRRPVRARRRRVLLVPRPRRRPAQGGRHLGRVRSRSRAACSRTPASAECAVVGHEEDGLVVRSRLRRRRRRRPRRTDEAARRAHRPRPRASSRRTRRRATSASWTSCPEDRQRQGRPQGAQRGPSTFHDRF